MLVCDLRGGPGLAARPGGYMTEEQNVRKQSHGQRLRQGPRLTAAGGRAAVGLPPHKPDFRVSLPSPTGTYLPRGHIVCSTVPRKYYQNVVPKTYDSSLCKILTPSIKLNNP